MSTQRVFQIIIVVAWLLQLLSYVLPIPTFYANPAFAKLMAFDGYGAVLSEDIPLLSVFPLWAFLIATVGLFFFQNWGRYLYLSLWAYGWFSTLLFGVRIALPAQGFLGMALGTLDGVILALAFLSPLRASFPNTAVKQDAPQAARLLP